MATQTRYAVRRNEVQGNRQWWWQNEREDYKPSWETRHLFDEPAGALAVIWKGRANDPHGRNYTYHLIRVTRTFEELPTRTPDPPAPQAEARVP